MKNKFMRILSNPVVLWSLATLLLCSVSWAADGGHGHEEGVPRVVLYQAINFFGLMAIFFFLFRKKVTAYFASRHSTLTSALHEAQRLREEAQKKHEEYSLKIQKFEREAGQMLEQIRHEGEEAKKRILEEARKLAQNIEHEAKKTADNEIERAKAELYSDILEQALEGAHLLLAKSVVEKDQRRLQKEFVEKIEAVQ